MIRSIYEALYRYENNAVMKVNALMKITKTVEPAVEAVLQNINYSNVKKVVEPPNLTVCSNEKQLI
jgi:hypothetical protein